MAKVLKKDVFIILGINKLLFNLKIKLNTKLWKLLAFP